jgi:FKBP-type peptidyl-prolyl cis-trans isomerase FklB
LYIPQELGYGDRQSGQIPPYSTLIFTVELVDITPDATAKPAVKAAQAKMAAKK